MEKKLLLIFLCGAILLGFTTGCSNDDGSKSNENNSNNSNQTEKENDVSYSKCARAGQQCTEEEIYDGQLVNISVNEKTSYDFYVISDDGENLTLLMDGHLGGPVAWTSSEDNENVFKESEGSDNNNYGPYTVLKELNNLTSDWTNIKKIDNFEFTRPDDFVGYLGLKISDGKITITSSENNEINVPGTSRARLMTVAEAEQIRGENSTHAKWLFSTLKKEAAEAPSDSGANYWYYWLLDSSKSNRAASTATTFENLIQVNVWDTLLLYPVITVDKTSIN